MILLLLSLNGMKGELALLLLTSHQLAPGSKLLTLTELVTAESQSSQDPQGISLLKRPAMLQKCSLVE